MFNLIVAYENGTVEKRPMRLAKNWSAAATMLKNFVEEKEASGEKIIQALIETK